MTRDKAVLNIVSQRLHAHHSSMSDASFQYAGKHRECFGGQEYILRTGTRKKSGWTNMLPNTDDVGKIVVLAAHDPAAPNFLHIYVFPFAVYLEIYDQVPFITEGKRTIPKGVPYRHSLDVHHHKCACGSGYLEFIRKNSKPGIKPCGGECQYYCWRLTKEQESEVMNSRQIASPCVTI